MSPLRGRTFECWALEDLNLRPLPCQGRPAQRSDQHLPSSGHLRRVSGVPSSTVCFVRLLDLVLTRDLAAKGGSRMAPGMVEDPVCGMRIDPDDAAGTAEYGGKLYYFCSE